jgi:hypothetical protein
MDDNIKINEINNFLSKELWYDFEISNSNFEKICIIGSIDFSYGHQIELYFLDVIHLTINETWKSDTKKKIFTILSGKEKEIFINNFGLESGFKIIKIINEDFKPFYIVTKEFDYNFIKVYYYKKENLKENERIAEWIK